MNCAQCRETMLARLEDELDADAAAAVDDHLAGCDDCRGQYADLAQARAALLELSDPPVQLEATAVLARAALRARHRGRTWRWAGVAVALAALILVAASLARVRIELSADRLVLRWGRGATPATLTADDLHRALAARDARLAELEQLAQLLARESDRAARERRLLLEQVQQRLFAARRRDEARWRTVGRSVHALDLAQAATTRGESSTVPQTPLPGESP